MLIFDCFAVHIARLYRDGTMWHSEDANRVILLVPILLMSPRRETGRWNASFTVSAFLNQGFLLGIVVEAVIFIYS